jgi:hypothetical protein
VNAVELLATIRELFGQHPSTAGLSPEEVAGVLWRLRYVFENEPPEVCEVAAALEVLDIERGAAA